MVHGGFLFLFVCRDYNEICSERIPTEPSLEHA